MDPEIEKVVNAIRDQSFIVAKLYREIKGNAIKLQTLGEPLPGLEKITKDALTLFDELRTFSVGEN